MKLLKLTVLSSLLFSFLLTTVSCEKEEEKKKANLYTKSDLIMSGAQAVPVSNSTGSGTLSVSYDKRNKILNYTVTWFGLSGNPTSLGIYGPAPAGFLALTATGTPAPALVSITPSLGLPAAASGTYKGSILFDGTILREQHLLNYLYYIRVNTAAYPVGGEIRTQIKFQ
jgi:hypothetical protein